MTEMFGSLNFSLHASGFGGSLQELFQFELAGQMNIEFLEKCTG